MNEGSWVNGHFIPETTLIRAREMSVVFSCFKAFIILWKKEY